MARAVIAVGSNIQPEKYIPAAISLLADKVSLLAVSAVYETPPVGAPGTPPFLNMAVLVATDLAPPELRERVLQPIEQTLERVRHADPNAPRTIDLDLVLYAGRGYTYQAPDVIKYAHVAIPVADVVPDWPVGESHTVLDIARRFQREATRFRRRPDVERCLPGMQSRVVHSETSE